MLQKGLIALLVLMLIVIVVFTSLGIAYNKSDFMSTMLKVEHGLGDTSDKVMTTYSKTKGIFDKIDDLVSRYVNFGDLFEGFYSGAMRTFEKISANFSLIGDFGIDGKFFKNLAVMYRCFNNGDFWDDKYNFNYDDAKLLIEAFVYEKDNKYSYLIEKDKQDLTNKFNNAPVDMTYCIYSVAYGSENRISPNIDDCFAWFQSCDLSFTDNQMFYAGSAERSNLALDFRYFPISKTNIHYLFVDGCDTKAVGFSISRLTHSGNKILEKTSNWFYNISFDNLSIEIDGLQYYINFWFRDTTNPDSTGDLVMVSGIDVLLQMADFDFKTFNRLLFTYNYRAFSVAGLKQRDDLFLN